MMIDFIKKTAHFFLDHPLNYIKDLNASRKISAHLSDIKKDKKNEKIKVGFIVQMPEVWDQQCSTYERLAADDRFDVWIVRMPQFDIGDGKYKNYKEVKGFFSEKYPNASFFDGIDKDGRIKELKKEKFDYLFYERPYDGYLPKTMRSTYMARYTKVCYIPYTTPDFDCGKGPYTADKVFYRNVYFGFHNSDSCVDALYASMSKRFRKHHHYLNLGYPVLNESTKVKAVPHEGCKVMWTPRWSYDPGIGGSHFLEYKDLIINLNKEFDGMNVLIRPHPFTYTYMISKGYMTEKEVEKFKSKAVENGVEFDKNKSVRDSFKDTDILVSDLSSIVWQFFYQGKPVIYCPCDIHLSGELSELVSATYIAENEDDIRNYIKEISSGNDYKKPERQKIIDKYINRFNDPVGEFIKYLIKDYNGEL